MDDVNVAPHVSEPMPGERLSLPLEEQSLAAGSPPDSTSYAKRTSTARDGSKSDSPGVGPAATGLELVVDPSEHTKIVSNSELVEKTFLSDFPSNLGKAPEAPIWGLYVKEAKEFDDRMIEEWNDSMDVLLIFAALFSAVLTAFVIESSPALQQDNTQATVDALQAISVQLAAISSGVSANGSVYQPSQTFTPPAWALWANAFWFLSLTLSLISTVVATLLKQWLRGYTANLSSIPAERARQRHLRYLGIIEWHVPGIVSSLPLLIHVSVFLFFAGLAAFLWTLSISIAAAVSGVFGLATLAYFVSAIIPLRVVNCPYKSPLTAVMSGLIEPFVEFSYFPKVTIPFFLQFPVRLMLSMGNSEQRLRLLDQLTYRWNLFISRMKTFPQSCVTFISNLISRTAAWFSDRRQRYHPATEKDAIQSEENKIDLLAFDWLMTMSSDHSVQEAALLALVGWQAPAKTWSDVGQAVATRTCTAITLRTAKARTYDSAVTLVRQQLTELAALSPLVQTYRYLPDDKFFWTAFEMLSVQSQSEDIQSALLACAFRLYADSRVLLRRESLALSAINQIVRALDSPRVPIFGCCLILEYLQREVPKSVIKKSSLLPALALLFTSSPNIPSELLGSTLSLLDFLIQPQKPRPSLRVPAFSWNCDPGPFILRYCEKSDSLGMLEPLLLFLARTPSSVDGVNAAVVTVLCGKLQSESQSVFEAALQALAAVLPRLPPRSDLVNGVDRSLLVTYLIHAPSSSPGVGAACSLLSGLLGPTYPSEITHAFVLSGNLRRLVEAVREKGDGRLCVPTITAMSQCKCLMEPLPSNLLSSIVESRWLEMMRDCGFPYLFQGTERLNRQDAEVCLNHLLLRYEDLIMGSGVIDKLQQLYVEHGSKLEWPASHLFDRLRGWHGRPSHDGNETRGMMTPPAHEKHGNLSSRSRFTNQAP